MKLLKLLLFLLFIGSLLWVVVVAVQEATPDGKLIFIGLVFIAAAIPREPFTLILKKKEEEPESDQ